jgi:mRNA-degrading endonuclease RelE of RelBE toxin-antitoxin system
MRIEWRNKARKQLRKLGNPEVTRSILAAIEDFAAGKPCDVKALVNHAYSHRLRVGAFRVLMTVDTVIEVSWIEEVKKRDERTY